MLFLLACATPTADDTNPGGIAPGDSSNPDPTTGNGGNDGGSDTGGDTPPSEAGDPPLVFTLSFASPLSANGQTIFTSGVLDVDVVALGDAPPTVDILVDGLVLATVEAPYTFSWNTVASTEGTHQLQARASTGTQDVLSSLLTVEVDRTPPTVVSRTPISGSANASFDAPIVVRFSEPLLSASLVPSDVLTLVDGRSVASTPTLAQGDTELVVALGTFPGPRSNLNVRLPASLTDRAGNALAMETWQWSLPVWQRLPGVGVGIGAANDAVLAHGDGSDVLLAWSQSDGTTTQVHTARWDTAGEDWEGLGTTVGFNPSRTTSLGAETPVLVADASGNHVVAWAEHRDGSQDVFVARYQGGDWMILGTALDRTLGNNATGPSVTVDGGGRPVVAWVETASTVHVARWDEGGLSWTELGNPVANAHSPRLAVGASGEPLLAFVDTSGAYDGVAVRGWNEGSGVWDTLSPRLNIETDRHAEAPSIVTSGTETWVAWAEHSSFSRRNVYVKGYQNNTWSMQGAAVDLELPADAHAPTLHVRSGTVDVAWREQLGSRTLALVARLHDNRWRILGDTVTEVSHGGSSVVSDNDGNIWFAAVEGSQTVVYRYNGVLSTTLDALPRGASTLTSNSTCNFEGAPGDPTFPMTLADTGCYANIAGNIVAAGFVPYDVTTVLWSDGAFKKRYLLLPSSGTITYTETGSWVFPNGTIVLKEFWIETVVGDPDSLRPVETRFLIQRSTLNWEGYSYRWRNDLTNGDLVSPNNPAVSETTDYAITDGGFGAVHTHYFPSRTQCLECHRDASGVPRYLSLQTAVLNRAFDYGPVVDNQLRTLDSMGAFGTTFPTTPVSLLPRFVDPYDPSASLDSRARSYLHINCSHCHPPNPVSDPDGMQLFAELPLADTDLCGPATVFTPVDFGNHRIFPGDPSQSSMYLRMVTRGASSGQMPRIATLVVDPLVSDLFNTWITDLATCPDN